MGALLVAELGQPFYRCCEEFALVQATELDVDAEVFLVEDLEEGVEETGEGGIVGLFYDLSASLLRVVFRSQSSQLVDIPLNLLVAYVECLETLHVHDIFCRLLVGASKHKLELVNRHAHSLKHSRYRMSVVLCSRFNKLEGSFQAVEEAMARSC